MQTAVSNTIMGVSIVFFVLVSLSFLIYLFRFIPMLEEKLTKKKIAEPVKQEVPVEVPVENIKITTPMDYYNFKAFVEAKENAE